MISIPYLGSKRNMVKRVEEIVQDYGYQDVYEPFGGSAVLTVNLYNDGLIKHGVINDYDNYFDLYPIYLDIKDDIIQKCYNKGIKRIMHYRGGYYKVDGDTRTQVDKLSLEPDQAEYLQSLVQQVDKKYWPYLATGYNFTYPAKNMDGVKLSDFKYFNRRLDTNIQRQYMKIIDQLERDSLDWESFLNWHKKNFTNKTLLIVDPPYVNTNTKQYKESFTPTQTQHIIDKLDELKCDFLFFNSNENKMRTWMATAGIRDYTLESTGKMNSSPNRKREEFMIFKRYSKSERHLLE